MALKGGGAKEETCALVTIRLGWGSARPLGIRWARAGKTAAGRSLAPDRGRPIPRAGPRPRIPGRPIPETALTEAVEVSDVADSTKDGDFKSSVYNIYGTSMYFKYMGIPYDNVIIM